MTPPVTVCVPWRPDHGDHDRNWAWTKERWHRFFPDWEIIASDDLHQTELFNNSQALNLAAEQAQGEILILADVDFTFEEFGVAAAVDTVRETGDWMIAKHFYLLTPEYTEEIVAGDPGITIPHEPPNYWYGNEDTTGGNLVIRKDVWREFGGYDERRRGRGANDTGLAITLDTLYRPGRYYPGTCYHLWHKREEGDSNMGLRFAYLAARGNREMLGLMHEGILVR